jgi:hypothetical protein
LNQYGSLYTIYENLQDCYDDVFLNDEGTELNCIQSVLPAEFEVNAVCGGGFDFQGYVNSLDTLNNITFDCN